jgi:uncharacterized protein with HEPN domain/predicted nucleotidyltransferase
MAHVVHKVNMAVVRERIHASPEQIAAFCRAHHIRWLAVFGSVLREDFTHDSDIDVLYALELGQRITSMDDLLAIEDDLSALMCGRTVDFISVKNLKWRIRNRVFADAEPLYGDPPEEVIHAKKIRLLHGDSIVRDENLYLGDMLDKVRELQEIVNGKTRADYDTNRLLQLSVLHLVQTIGEAATKVSRQTRDSNPATQWAHIIGMRNVLVHRYDDVDDTVIWKTVTDDLAPLIAELERMLPPEMQAEQ